MLQKKIIRNNTIFNNIKMAYYPTNFKIYTDGACINNGKHNAKCSIGIHFSNNNTFKITDISKVLTVPKHSNNIAELTAIQEALKIYDNNDLMLPLQIYSDSKYSINCITKWYPTWVEKKCLNDKQNIKLIKEIYDKYTNMKLKYQVDLIYIKAHSGFNDEHSIGNSIADRLANDALKKINNKQIDIRKFFQNDI